MAERIGRTATEGGNVRSLQDAIRRMRVVATERADGVADLSAAERARLELLAEELAEVFRAVPPEADFFAFSVSPGDNPRLWIDMTTHVAMGRDRRTYRFLKDTRLGRTVILETAELGAMADCVTDYVAERVIEREKAVEAGWLMSRFVRPSRVDALAPSPTRTRAESPQEGSEPAPVRSTRVPGFVTFLAGTLVGAGGLILYAWLKTGF